MARSGTTSQTQSQSQTAPWKPTQPILQGILGGVQSQLPNYAANPAEQQALTQLQGNVGAVPNFAPQATDITNQFLGGDPTGLLSPALQNYNNVLNPIATGNLDPNQTPGIQNVLSTIKNDVSNSVNQQFAGAGRDLSGLNQQALARGIAQGEAQPLLAQYNQNVSNAMGAAGNMYNAAGNTASAITGNQTQGINAAGMIPGLAGSQPSALLSALNQNLQFPLQNLGMLANLTVPIAGLGSQNSGSSYTQGTQTASPLQVGESIFSTAFPYGFQR